MNPRERFKETMAYGTADRVPLFREGMRDEVVRTWIKQGLKSEKELSRLFQYDQREEIDPNLYASFPIIHPATGEVDLDRLREDLNPEDKKRLPKRWKSKIRKWRQRDHVLMLTVHEGLFLGMGVGEWRTFAPVIELLIDQPEIARKIMQIQGDFCAGITERILQDVDVDAVIFYEPISGMHGPLVSPKLYEDLVLPSFEPVFEVLDRYGIETLIFRTYANSRILLPLVFQTPINCLWAAESNMEFMNYLEIREEFGKDVRLIGGIDTDALIRGQEAIQQEIEGKVPRLLEQGGYIPLADARIRKYVPFENYVYYREMLEKMVRNFYGIGDDSPP
jgi:uroporphyrinogen decarboxylase